MSHLVVIALGRDLSDQVRDYIVSLVERGERVDLVLASPRSWQAGDAQRWARVAAAPSVAVHQLNGAEHQHVLRRLERTVVHRIPLGMLGLAGAKGLQRKYSRAALKLHRKLFIRAWRIMQPWAMARLFRTRLSDVDFTNVDRIVAADIYGLTLGWQLAKRHPQIPATRSLEA